MSTDKPEWADWLDGHHIDDALALIRAKREDWLIVSKPIKMGDLTKMTDLTVDQTGGYSYKVLPHDIVAWGFQTMDLRLVNRFYFGIVEDVAVSAMQFMREGLHPSKAPDFYETCHRVLGYAMQSCDKDVTLRQFLRGRAAR